MVLRAALVVLAFCGLFAPALAQRPDPAVVEADVWAELPTQLVEGRADMAIADFATKDGASTVRFRATGGEVQLTRIELVYKDGSTQVLDVRNGLGVGEMTGPVSLPRSTVPLKEMRIFVASTSPLGAARRIATFATGGKTKAAQTSAPATPRGWIPIGLKRVTVGEQREIISLGRDRGRFVGLALRPRDAAIMLRELRIVYVGGETTVAALSKRIEQDGLTPPLKVNPELPIQEVQVLFEVSSGLNSGRALLELLGAYDPDYVGNEGSVISVNGGWLMLGVQSAAQFRGDGDYALGRNFGSFNRLRFLPRNGDAEIREVHLTLANGPPVVLPVNQILRAGRASPLIEVPKTADGERAVITSITINRKGRSQLRGDTMVEVWGQY